MAWISPLLKRRQAQRGKIRSTLTNVIKKLGEPNLQDIEDDPLINASWGFKDDQEREAWVWGYYTNKDYEIFWKCGGDPFLLQKIFGHSFEGSISGWV